MRRTTLLLAVTLGMTGLPLMADPAFAAFNVCNRSSLAVRAAIGRFDGTHWTSEGWWTIQPQACAPILTGPLQGRFYYLYASDGAAGTWEGKTYFCVAPDKRFRAVGRGTCAKRGFDRRGFFEVDTGKKPDWTQSLSN
ncbi:MAG TPA: DUF1036 domain-containing protein [Rhizomicrobium sp.]|nr:DUF1036 domain-containing protein [Rhizomicrobium sp.]